MSEEIYMAVTADKYELPLFVGDNVLDLALLTKVHTPTIYKALQRNSIVQINNFRLRFVKVTEEPVSIPKELIDALKNFWLSDDTIKKIIPKMDFAETLEIIAMNYPIIHKGNSYKIATINEINEAIKQANFIRNYMRQLATQLTPLTDFLKQIALKEKN